MLARWMLPPWHYPSHICHSCRQPQQHQVDKSRFWLSLSLFSIVNLYKARSSLTSQCDGKWIVSCLILNYASNVVCIVQHCDIAVHWSIEKHCATDWNEKNVTSKKDEKITLLMMKTMVTWIMSYILHHHPTAEMMFGSLVFCSVSFARR